MLRAFRLVKARRAERAFDGEGARRYGGRWNPPGLAVVYASESVALAALELLVHLEEQAALGHYAVCPVRLPEAGVETVDPKALPDDWRSSPPPLALQEIGAAWLREARSAALAVPSAIVPSERNFLLNPAHPEFPRLRRDPPYPFPLDPRLMRAR
jgi:RES domain-containing protein